jgi:septal ring factor EnvC (AmiA/AmiB activator)
MPQIAMFPLSAEELQAKGKEQAALELKFEQILDEKDTRNREYNEELKRLRGQILRLAKEIDREQEEREASDAEAPWQGLMDQAEEVAKRGSRRRTRRGVDGEVIEEADGG